MAVIPAARIPSITVEYIQIATVKPCCSTRHAVIDAMLQYHDEADMAQGLVRALAECPPCAMSGHQSVTAVAVPCRHFLEVDGNGRRTMNPVSTRF